jgi:hypothetical protein
MKDHFEIVTLSDCLGCNQKKTLRNSNMNYRGSNNLGDISGVISDVLGLFGSIFGRSIDPGHWEGSLYIPGDLNSRIAITQQRIALSGLEQYASQGEWLLILKTPGIWQENISRYIGNVLEGRKKGDIPMPRSTSNGSSQTGIAGLGSLLPIILLGGLAFGFFSSAPKKRRNGD